LAITDDLVADNKRTGRQKKQTPELQAKFLDKIR
jgi:hypothetical protein